jgi:RHH-type proline utilization regulon transcriptional repressor/proline dehydrogenase/delta 1-pyrroline-5-carboxylate dehydrogenase
MTRDQNLEEKIKSTGVEIFSLMEGEVPSVFDTKRWTGGLMEWAMKDDDFKVQLLRFVDLLPSLNTDALVVRLLKEYFADKEITPMIMKWGMKGLSEKGILQKIAGKAIRLNVETMARQFIAGRGPKEALVVLKALRKEGFVFTVDLLGEVVVSDREAAEYSERYLTLLDFLHPAVSGWEEVPILDTDHFGPIPKLNISLKISSFYSQLDPIDWEGSIEKAKEGIRPVFERHGRSMRLSQ